MNEFEQIKEMGQGLPAPRDEARDAARAALMARSEPADGPISASIGPFPARRRWRSLAFAGSLATVAAALVILATGGGSGVRPEVASAAALERLAATAPHLGIAGGWQIVHTVASPEGGETRFHYERDPTGATPDVEIRWHTASVEETEERLEAEGFEAAGTQPTRTTDALAWREMILEPAKYGEEGRTFDSSGTARVYVSSGEGGQLQTVGVWREGGWTFELRSRESLELLERKLERLELLGPEEWLVAVRPGGGEWLRESYFGTVEKVEKKRTVMPDGQVVFETRSTARSPERLEKLDFTAPFPVVHREGDSVRVEIARAPE